MTGITPPTFTFRGRWVDCPPMTLRPTTRLAYCTGIRLCALSTNTMNPTTTTMMDSRSMTNSGDHCCCTSRVKISWPALGKPLTIPAKMIRDIPFPMPLSVILSPSHMMNAVPVVWVSMVMNTNPNPGFRTT